MTEGPYYVKLNDAEQDIVFSALRFFAMHAELGGNADFEKRISSVCNKLATGQVIEARDWNRQEAIENLRLGGMSAEDAHEATSNMVD